jgi:AH receptor-interacting protein
VVISFPDNVKALFRRARAHAGAWNPAEAKSDFERVSQLDPSLSQTCAKEIRKIEELEKQKNQEDKEKMKMLFKT